MSAPVVDLFGRERPANFADLGPDEYHGIVWNLVPHPHSMPPWARALNWIARSKKTDKGTPAQCFELAPTVDNIVGILMGDPRWAGVLGFDEFSARLIVRKNPPWGDILREGRQFAPGSEWRDESCTRLVGWLSRAYRFRMTEDAAHKAALIAGELRGFNPLTDYLNGLVWDGVPRAETWLCRAFGADDTPLHAAYGKMFLASAVARAMRPGEKVDTCLVLEGGQGMRKSTAIAALAGGRPYFSEIYGDVDHKDTLQLLRGLWIGEFAELSTFKRSDVESLKRFLATQEDRYRDSYGRITKNYPRSCVFIASTNKEQYLQDETGARRFWPVRCGSRADVAWIWENRDQLWAEAVLSYRNHGCKWHLEGDLEAASAEAASERFEEDVWDGRVLEYGASRDRVTISEVMLSLGIETARQTRTDQMRIAKILRHAGWKLRSVRRGGSVFREWNNPTPPYTAGS